MAVLHLWPLEITNRKYSSLIDKFQLYQISNNHFRSTPIIITDNDTRDRLYKNNTGGAPGQGQGLQTGGGSNGGTTGSNNNPQPGQVRQKSGAATIMDKVQFSVMALGTTMFVMMRVYWAGDIGVVFREGSKHVA